jgi:hypothetical protein
LNSINDAVYVFADGVEDALDQLWNSIAEMKDFATRRLNFFTRAAFSRQMLSHTELSASEASSPLKKYFLKVLQVAEGSFMVSNALALQLVKAMTGNEKLALLYVDEVMKLLTWGVPRQGTTDTKSNEQAETGYSGCVPTQ